MPSTVLVPNQQIPSVVKLGSSPIFDANKGLHGPQVTPDFDGFAKSHPWVGQKMGKVQHLPGGFFQQFQAATVYCVYGGEPFEVHGPIRDKYAQLNGPMGVLGFPTTNQTKAPDGAGQFNHFEHGSIYWHPAIGAFAVHGPIHAKWASLGWETFGYPFTDVSSTLGGVGRYIHVRAFLSDGSATERSIYWNPNIGAYDVCDGIREKWSELGWELGFLGYPVSDEYDVGGGRRSDFENGSIAWTPAMGVQVQPERLVVDAPNITFEAGIAVGGYGRLEVFSDGITHAWGHLHDSGMAPYDCLIVFTVKDTDGHAYAASQSGTVHGLDPGSRNLDWDEWGENSEIQRNWAKIRSACTGGHRVEVTSDWTPGRIADFVLKIVGVVAAVIALIGGSAIFGSKKSADPNYNPPEAYPPGGLPPPDTGIQTIP